MYTNNKQLSEQSAPRCELKYANIVLLAYNLSSEGGVAVPRVHGIAPGFWRDFWVKNLKMTCGNF